MFRCCSLNNNNHYLDAMTVIVHIVRQCVWKIKQNNDDEKLPKKDLHCLLRHSIKDTSKS